MTVDGRLVQILERSSVRIEEIDGDTIRLRDVPANARFFNKTRTNILIKRPRKGLPFVACVDEDLKYTGSDAQLARVFTGVGCQRGWRVLSLAPDAGPEATEAIDAALKAVGFNNRDPAVVSAGPGNAGAAGALASFGTSLTPLVLNGEAEPCVGRKDQIEEAVCCLLQHHVRLPLIVSAPGVGKTNFLHGVARGLVGIGRSSRDVVLVDLGELFSGTLFHSEREKAFADLLEQASASPGTAVAMEHLELALAEVPHGPYLLAQALDRGARLIGTTLPQYVQPFTLGALARRVQIIELAPLVPGDACEALLGHRDRVASHHGVAIPDALVRAVVDQARSVEGPLPATAVELLDAAAARAVAGREAEVGLHHLHMAAGGLPDRADHVGSGDVLRERPFPQ